MKTPASVAVTTAGVGFALATVAAKKYFPDTLGRSFPLFVGLDVMGSALLALGLFLALRDLFGGTSRPWIAMVAVGYAFLGTAYVTVSPVVEYIVFTNIDRTLSPWINEILPKLVNKARTADTQAKRMLMAQRAYQYCDVLITYRQDNGSYVEYSPSDVDTAFATKFQAEQNNNARLKDQIIGGQIRQLPYVLAIEFASFTLTLLTALCWFAAKQSKAAALLAP
jgi:hypothetical protein